MVDNTNIPIETALKIADKHLKQVGISDKMIVKIKPFTGHYRHALALYRSGSQFRHLPVFWINERFDDIVKRVEKEMEEEGLPYNLELSSMPSIPLDSDSYNMEDVILKHLVDSLLHEYGHVIAEFFFYRR